MVVKLDRHDASSAAIENALGLHFLYKTKKNSHQYNTSYVHTAKLANVFSLKIIFPLYIRYIAALSVSFTLHAPPAPDFDVLVCSTRG